MTSREGRCSWSLWFVLGASLVGIVLLARCLAPDSQSWVLQNADHGSEAGTVLESGNHHLSAEGKSHAEYAASCSSSSLLHAERIYLKNFGNRLAVIGGSHPLPPYLGFSMERVSSIFLVPLYPCPAMMRVGEWGGNGKRLCASVTSPLNGSVVYSIGSYGETSFEEQMHQEFGVVPFTFDPFLTPEQLHSVQSVTYLKFFSVGIAAEAEKAGMSLQNPGKKFSSLPEVMGHLGHHFIKVLKIDCEGCEEGVFAEAAHRWTREDVPFGQVLVEIHKANQPQATLSMVMLLEGLGFRMFNAEPNPKCSECYELAFVHERELR